MKTKILPCLAAAALAGVTTHQASAANVALELILLVDTSGSVDATEYGLQKGGYVTAFNSPAIQGLISSLTGGLAVTYIDWSGHNQFSQEVGWTVITNAAESTAFATAVNNSVRNFSGLTAPGSAINDAFPLFASNGHDGLRQVIDVSGDGEQNDGEDTSDARDAALAAGVDRINGLAINTPDFPSLNTWYAANIQGGTNSFTVAVDSFADFSAAIETKLRAEITDTRPPGVPEGGPGLILGGLLLVGLFGFQARFGVRRAVS